MAKRPTSKAPERSYDFADLPDTVQIGYRTYRLEILSDWDADTHNDYARIDAAKGIIQFNPWLDPQKAANSLLHEILHGIWNVWDLHNGKNPGHMADITTSEEAIVVSMADGLSTVMLQNPELMGWIQRHLIPKKQVDK